MATEEMKAKWQIEREQRRKEEREFRENLVNEYINNEYGFTKPTAELLVNKAWEDGHSCGYAEVRTQASILADFVEEVIKLNHE